MAGNRNAIGGLGARLQPGVLGVKVGGEGGPLEPVWIAATGEGLLVLGPPPLDEGIFSGRCGVGHWPFLHDIGIMAGR